RCHRVLGDQNAALADFDEAIRLRPWEPGLRADRAWLLRQFGREREAVDDWERVVTAFKHPAGEMELARLYVVGPEDVRNPARALELSRKAQKGFEEGKATMLAQWTRTNHTIQGAAFYRLGQHKEALRLLEQARRGGGDTPPYTMLFFLAMTQQAL